MKQCGLAQNHSVTVPFIVSFFSVSNAELPWCANSGIETIITPTARTKTIKNLSFTDDLLSLVSTGHIIKPTACGKVLRKVSHNSNAFLSGYGLSMPLAALPKNL